MWLLTRTSHSCHGASSFLAPSEAARSTLGSLAAAESQLAWRIDLANSTAAAAANEVGDGEKCGRPECIARRQEQSLERPIIFAD